MTNTLKINKVTCNSITFEWKVEDIAAGHRSLSKSCALKSDTYPMCFTLSLHPKKNPKFRISCSRKGRAIIKFALDNIDTAHILDLIFVESWNHHFYRDLPIELTDRAITLIIRCNIIWLGCTDEQDIPSDHLTPLSIANIPYDNTQSPDLYINIDDYKLSAHKAILARHSLILAAMLQTPKKASQENNEITIEDIDYSTMKSVLKIIYTGSTEDLDNIDTALKVLEAGEKYQMPIVKSASEQKLLFAITDDNVLGLLDEANLHNATSLRYTCVEYIIARGDKVVPSAELTKMCDETPFIQAAVNELQFDFFRFLTYKTASF